MTESYPSDQLLNALSGTTDAQQEVLFLPIGEAPYYTSFYKMLYRLLDVARRAGDLRVYKDATGALKFGVRPGRWLNGDTAVNYAGATSQTLADNATNYIYLTASGVLTVNQSDFPVPSETPHLPLATIATGTSSAGGVTGIYAHGDITDYRGRAFLSVPGAAGGGGNAEADAFFAATDISGAEAETLSAGSSSDAQSLHTHANKLGTTLASGNILVGNGSNVATAVAMSGDATIANTGAVTISRNKMELFHFPSVGTTKTLQHAYEDGNILYLGAGNSGVIRTIWFTTHTFPEGGDNSARLRIYSGTGNLTPPYAPNANYLLVDLPLFSLMGCWFTGEPTTPRWIETSIFDSGVDAGRHKSFQLRLPMPFSNGCLIQVGYGNGVNFVPLSTAVWSWVSYETGTLPSGLGDYRLRSAGFHGNLTSNQPTVFLNRASGDGVLAAILASQQVTDPGEYEYNWSFKFDGASSPQWETSGTEDLFGCNPFYFDLGTIQRLRGGTIAKLSIASPAQYVHESYRIFDSDPLCWANGAIGYLGSHAFTGTQTAHIETLFYEKP